MKEDVYQIPMSGDNRVKVEDQLSKILESSHFRSASKLKQFLAFVVEQTLEGNGEQLKQYTIAVDALEYADDFDADTNPAIRILAGRVRERLNKYYENEGVNDAVVITIAKGQYSAVFENSLVEHSSVEGTTVESVAFKNENTANATLNENSKTIKINPLYVAAAIVALLGIAYAIYHSKFTEITPQSATNTIPLVDVMPFENLSTVPRGPLLAKGVRYQLLTELSHFKTIRVRDVPVDNTEVNELRAADFEIQGGLLANDENLQMNILVQDAKTNEVLWTNKISVPTTDAGFNELIFEGILGVISKITGPNSVMQLNAMKKLRDRLDNDKNVATSSYECVLIFYDYDNTKDPETENEARKCLAEHTSEGVENSSLWAVHGTMTILDWSKRKDESDNSLLEQALQSFQKAIQIDPSNAQAHEYYGNYHMVIGNFDEATLAYEKAVELNPSKPAVHVAIGWNQINKGDWDNGIKEIKEGISMSFQAPGWFHIPVAVDAFRRGDYEESLKEAQLLAVDDKRRIGLVLAPAIKLQRIDLVERYTQQYYEYRKEDLAEPLREVGNVLKAPKVLMSYTETITPVLDRLNTNINTLIN